MRDNRPSSLPESFPGLRPSVVEQHHNVVAAALSQLQGRTQQRDGEEPLTTGKNEFNSRLLAADREFAPDATSCSRGAASSAADGLSLPLLKGDRRGFPRHDSRCITLVLRQEDARAEGGYATEWLLHASKLRGSVIDVSMSGVAFTVDKALEKGDELMLRMLNRVFDLPVDKQALVVRSSSLGRGQWKAVCKFQRTLSYDEVSLLGLKIGAAGLV